MQSFEELVFGFVERHKKVVSHLVARPVEHIRVIAFNANFVLAFMAQAEIAYAKYSIKNPWQVLNLDETGFTHGRDLTDKTSNRVVTTVG